MSASRSSSGIGRRVFLIATAIGLGLTHKMAHALTIKGMLPWRVNAAAPPVPVEPGPWQFFSPAEGKTIEALVDRLIPPDPQFAGGKDAGCAVYIDRQLVGPFGSSFGLYREGPFVKGASPLLGDQSAATPSAQYRTALAALDDHCSKTFAGKRFADLPDDQKDKVIAGLESGSIKFTEGDSKAFFKMLLTNTQEGFFADPLYGGNRDMVGWKMIGFPGARYDYRDWVDRHNERYPHPPIGIQVRSN